MKSGDVLLLVGLLVLSYSQSLKQLTYRIIGWPTEVSLLVLARRSPL